MPESWQHYRRYDSSFATAVLAFTLRYPNPLTPHIVSVDVVSRQVSLQSGCLYTDRIILKRGAASALPKWFPTSILGKTEAWIFERSCVDVEGNEAVVMTRNLDHRHVMDLQEDLFIYSDVAKEPEITHFDTDARATSSVGFSILQSRIEVFSINRYKLSVERSRNQIHRIIELLKNTNLHAALLEGTSPPLSAMLGPAIGESLTRWEELGSGFSGHGFDDRDKERFLPDPNPPEQAAITGQTYTDWFREKRAITVQNASERLSNIRARLFRWRLHMREVEREELVDPPPKAITPSSPTNDSNLQSADQGPNTPKQDEEPPQPQVKKSKSWVWQWSRHG